MVLDAGFPIFISDGHFISTSKMEMIVDKESFWQPAGLVCSIHTIKLHALIIVITKNYNKKMTWKNAGLLGRDLCYATLYNCSYIYFFLLHKRNANTCSSQNCFQQCYHQLGKYTVHVERKCSAKCMYEKHRKPSLRGFFLPLWYRTVQTEKLVWKRGFNSFYCSYNNIFNACTE